MFDFFLFTHIYITKKQKIFTFLDSDKVKQNLTPTLVIFEIYKGGGESDTFRNQN